MINERQKYLLSRYWANIISDEERNELEEAVELDENLKESLEGLKLAFARVILSEKIENYREVYNNKWWIRIFRNHKLVFTLSFSLLIGLISLILYKPFHEERKDFSIVGIPIDSVAKHQDSIINALNHSEQKISEKVTYPNTKEKLKKIVAISIYLPIIPFDKNREIESLNKDSIDFFKKNDDSIKLA